MLRSIQNHISFLKFLFIIVLVILAGSWAREYAWRVTSNTLSLIGRFEGWCPDLYKCPAGYWTIGYGHLISFEKDISYEEATELFKEQVRVMPMSAEQKDEIFASLNLNGQLNETGGLSLLHADTKYFVEVNSFLDPEILSRLTSSQVDALASLTFNLGADTIARSTLVNQINKGKTTPDIADWISAFRNVEGRVLLGLAKRRLVEVMIFMNRSLDSESDEVPSAQWGVAPMRYADENWRLLREADAKNSWRLLHDATRIFEEYMTLVEADLNRIHSLQISLK